ncbi:MAG: hypothetical protein ACLFVY_04350 [Phycisphaerae bacterium]
MRDAKDVVGSKPNRPGIPRLTRSSEGIVDSGHAEAIVALNAPNPPGSTQRNCKMRVTKALHRFDICVQPKLTAKGLLRAGMELENAPGLCEDCPRPRGSREQAQP